MDTVKVLSEVGKLIPTVECLIVKDGKVLLLKRSETAKRFPGWWIGPGGHVDENEDYLSAAIRETWEETGIRIETDEIKLKVVAIGNHLDRKEVYIVLYFLIKLTSDQKIVNSEEGKSTWFSIDEVRKMDKVFPPFKFYLDHALSDKPGILYTNLQLENMEVIDVKSRRVDKDY